MLLKYIYNIVRFEIDSSARQHVLNKVEHEIVDDLIMLLKGEERKYMQ